MKIRNGFVANSSSSSFLILGKMIKNEYLDEYDDKKHPDIIMAKEHKLNVRNSPDDGTIIGVSLPHGDDNLCVCDVNEYLEKIHAAIEKCKAAGIESPKIYNRVWQDY